MKKYLTIYTLALLSVFMFFLNQDVPHNTISSLKEEYYSGQTNNESLASYLEYEVNNYIIGLIVITTTLFYRIKALTIESDRQTGFDPFYLTFIITAVFYFAMFNNYFSAYSIVSLIICALIILGTNFHAGGYISDELSDLQSRWGETVEINRRDIIIFLAVFIVSIIIYTTYFTNVKARIGILLVSLILFFIFTRYLISQKRNKVIMIRQKEREDNERKKNER